MSLSEEAITLQRAAHDLMYLGMDGSPVYSDDLSRRNGEVYRLTMALYRSGVKGTTIDEQANVCLALLMGYSAPFMAKSSCMSRKCWTVVGMCSMPFPLPY